MDQSYISWFAPQNIYCKTCHWCSKQRQKFISLETVIYYNLFFIETRHLYKILYIYVCVVVVHLLMCNVLPNKVTYTGASVVHENQAWSIKCSNLKPDDLIRWTRNGQSLEPELASGQLVVQSPVGSGSSTLQAMHATDNHEGDYKCTQDSDESFHLWIYYGSYIDFP